MGSTSSTFDDVDGMQDVDGMDVVEEDDVVGVVRRENEEVEE